jgi:uncharacterized lipoprotein YddW (UPF0748 family)
MKLLQSLSIALLLGLLSIPYFAHAQISPKREFRGVWVATVQNIDWPGKRGMTSDIQQQELLQILNEHEKSGINAIMLQIRPCMQTVKNRGACFYLVNKGRHRSHFTIRLDLQLMRLIKELWNYMPGSIPTVPPTIWLIRT